MKVIFLDIDGVLNNANTKDRTPDKFIGIEDIFVKRLVDIVRSTKAKVVLSSSWRTMKEDEPDYIYMIDKLKSKGIELYGYTTKKGWNRAEQIKNWLSDKPEVDNFIILDDEFELEFAEGGYTDNLVKTEYAIGLTEEKKQEAINKLSK